MSSVTIDPMAVLVALLGGLLPIAFSLTVLYRVALREHPIVVAYRRSVIARDYWRWPVRDPLPGMFPFGLGVLLAVLGRMLSGQTVSLGQLPTDPPQYLSLIGVALVIVGFGFTIWPPRWVLPAWYREVRERRRTVPSSVLVAADQIRTDLESLEGDLSEAMTRATEIRDGVAHGAAWPAIEAATRAERRATSLAGRIDDDVLFERVGAWKRTFDATPKGGRINELTGASSGASEAEWQLLTDAADAALAHIKSVVVAMGRTVPRL